MARSAQKFFVVCSGVAVLVLSCPVIAAACPCGHKHSVQPKSQQAPLAPVAPVPDIQAVMADDAMPHHPVPDDPFGWSAAQREARYEREGFELEKKMRVFVRKEDQRREVEALTSKRQRNDALHFGHFWRTKAAAAAVKARRDAVDAAIAQHYAARAAAEDKAFNERLVEARQYNRDQASQALERMHDCFSRMTPTQRAMLAQRLKGQAER